MSKNLARLDFVCEQVSAEYGTIRTSGLDYNYWIKKELERCINEKRENVEAILNKYSNYGKREASHYRN